MFSVDEINKYDYVLSDITNNCNLRCPFCLNDFSKNQQTVFMTEAVWEKVLPLLPLVEDGRFLFSCDFEPSIHPNFISFLEKIAERFRKKVFLTTNLTTKLKDEDIKRLAHISLHHINISIDSFNPAVFEQLRKGARFERFIDNLERMVSIFSRHPEAPPLQYITIVLKHNLTEIPDLTESCAKHYLSAFHELRHVYECSHFSSGWRERSLISNEDWTQLQRFAQTSPYRCIVVAPPPIYYPDDGQPYSRDARGKGDLFTLMFPVGFLFALKINSNGIISLFGKREIHFNISDISDPFRFFNERSPYFRDLMQNHSKRQTRPQGNRGAE